MKQSGSYPRHYFITLRASTLAISLVLLNATWLLWVNDSILNSMEPASHRVLQGMEPVTKVSDCPHDVNEYFDPVELKEALHRKDDFTKRGGNLKAVQQFRDRSIDSTLLQNKIKFVPNAKRDKETQDLTRYLRKYYDENYDSRGGYGKPLPGKFEGTNTNMMMADRWIEPVESFQGREKWDVALGPIGPNCKNLLQLGNKARDGYKFICMPSTESNRIEQLQGLSSQRQLSEDQECHVFSVGGNDNWKFETAVVETLGCTTHTFDCTLRDNTPRKKPRRDDIRFYPYCIDGRSYTDTHGRNYRTYSDLLDMTGLTEKPPMYLKIDVEGFEFDIFAQMIQSAGSKMLPQQIQVELHWATRMTAVD